MSDNDNGSGKKWPREEDFVETDAVSASETAFEDDEIEPVAEEDRLDQPSDEAATASLEQPEISALEAKLTEAEQKVHDYWNEVMRAKAEMENMRRRSERDVANAHKYGVEKMAVELLAVMDSLEAGLGTKIEGEDLAANVYKGMELTRDMLLKTLEKFGVAQLNPIGDTFDPSVHEAVSTQPAEGQAANTVIAVMQKGYSLNERLIRPAMVVVSQ